MNENNNSSTAVDSNSTVVFNTHLFPVYARVLLIALYLAIVVISVGGNSLVISVIDSSSSKTACERSRIVS